MKISIVTPSFNQAAYIEQTIDSVLSQGYDDLEYVIIDGGSSDGSVAIIKKYEKYLKYWISEKDHGQSHAINKGLQHCTGDVFNWLNSDDYYEKDTFSILKEVFTDRTVNVLCGRSNLIKNDIVLQKSTGTDVYINNLYKTVGQARIDQPETFFRLNCVKEIGGVNEKLHYIMDQDLWIRYLLNYGLTGIRGDENILVNFRLHDQSKTISNSKKFNLERDKYFDVDFKRMAKNEKQQNVVDKAYQYHLILKVHEAYNAGKYELAKSIINDLNKDLIEQSDNTVINKMKVKMMIPQSLRNLYKKIKWN